MKKKILFTAAIFLASTSLVWSMQDPESPVTTIDPEKAMEFLPLVENVERVVVQDNERAVREDLESKHKRGKALLQSQPRNPVPAETQASAAPDPVPAPQEEAAPPPRRPRPKPASILPENLVAPQ